MKTVVVPGRTFRVGPRPPHAHATAPVAVHLTWFAAGTALGFAVPWLFTSVLDLQHDLYYAGYFGVVISFLALYARATALDAADMFRENWRWSLALGIPTAAFVVANVLLQSGTPGPSGAYAIFEVGWRGLMYGMVDALLLSAFPAAVAFALLSGRVAGLGRRALFALVMLPMVIVITGFYHLGYQQYREDGISGPETGNAIISIPTLLSANPLGSVVAHAAMHVAADLHSYETDTFLPPQTETP
jgi:hypothetical protein